MRLREARRDHPASRPDEPRRRDRERRSPTVPYSLIMDQVTNGVAVRMAILYLLVARSKAEDALRDRAGRRAGARPARGAGVSARLLLSGGRVVDPVAETVAAEDLLLEDGRIAARGPAGTIVGGGRDARRARLAGRCRVWSTCTCTCASRATSTRRRSRPASRAARGRRLHRRSPAWRTPIR